MSGGEGADIFHVEGTDTILDFDGTAGDRIATSSVLSSVADADSGALVTFADGSIVALLGVASGTISPDWFLST